MQASLRKAATPAALPRSSTRAGRPRVVAVRAAGAPGNNNNKKQGAGGAAQPAPRRSSSPAAAVPAALTTATPSVGVDIDTKSDPALTIVRVTGPNRPGLLTALTAAFRDLGLDVQKAEVVCEKGAVDDKFYVTTVNGDKLTDPAAIAALTASLEILLAASDTARTAGRALSRAASKRPALKGEAGNSLLANLMDTYQKSDVLSVEESIVQHVEYTLARSRTSFDNRDAYLATGYSLRDRLIEAWNDTNVYFREVDPKRVYYLSMEFLMGRSLTNALNNLGVSGPYREALTEMGYDLETIAEYERDAALGNGGLGRLAACFLDSMATTNLPAWGYGIRYQYGMFRQSIIDGFQHEQPDYWLSFGNPWEIERVQVVYPVHFYGHVSVNDVDGRQAFHWNPGESVTAIAYDNPIPGFQTNNTLNLRLWASRPDREFDLEAFNTGDYVQAILSRQRAETLSSVLYPDDRTYQGKELRLKQQHFFVSATMQDVVRRFTDIHGSDFSTFHKKVAFQLNDTHPTIAVAELMRLLMDEQGQGWTAAWEVATKVFAFTNHTVLPEALERWPVSLLEKLLPRHMQIIYDINWRWVQTLRAKLGDDHARIGRMSIIEDGPGGEKLVRMAYLAVVASHTVNGVAAIHSDIIRNTIFKDFADLEPSKFQNKTNGVTPRRWLAFCNPPLRDLITKTLGDDGWINDLDRLSGLSKSASDPAFLTEWRAVKATAKAKAMAKVAELTGVVGHPDALMVLQVKRIHEYKRQLLNVLGIIHRYDALKAMSPADRAKAVPRLCVIGGKAAPGYEMAKRIIKLVCAVADKVNSDPDIGDRLKVAFLPDYNVSLAEVVIPGSELNEQISTAGTEASGTGNMKFAMNGSLIIGTLDGANVEIAEEIGADNMFIFGATADQVGRLRAERGAFRPDASFEHVVGLIRRGTFGWADFFEPLCDSITSGADFYLVANDFPAYIDAQARVDAAYMDVDGWTKKSIASVAGSGFFSSDRTIKEYAKDIWGVTPVKVPSDGAGPATADPVTAASAALAAAFRESAVACTALASSSASDEATCRAASSAAQAALARARAAMRDLELLAEETDTPGDAASLADALRGHKSAYEAAAAAYREAGLAARCNAAAAAAAARRALLGRAESGGGSALSGDGGGGPRQPRSADGGGATGTAAVRLQTEGEAVAASTSVTAALARTRDLVASEIQHTGVALAALDASNDQLGATTGAYGEGASRLVQSKALLREHKRGATRDWLALWGGLALFGGAVAYVVLKRSAFFVPEAVRGAVPGPRDVWATVVNVFQRVKGEGGVLPPLAAPGEGGAGAALPAGFHPAALAATAAAAARSAASNLAALANRARGAAPNPTMVPLRPPMPPQPPPPSLVADEEGKASPAETAEALAAAAAAGEAAEKAAVQGAAAAARLAEEEAAARAREDETAAAAQREAEALAAMQAEAAARAATEAADAELARATAERSAAAEAAAAAVEAARVARAAIEAEEQVAVADREAKAAAAAAAAAEESRLAAEATAAEAERVRTAEVEVARLAAEAAAVEAERVRAAKAEAARLAAEAASVEAERVRAAKAEAARLAADPAAKRAAREAAERAALAKRRAEMAAGAVDEVAAPAATPLPLPSPSPPPPPAEPPVVTEEAMPAETPPATAPPPTAGAGEAPPPEAEVAAVEADPEFFDPTDEPDDEGAAAAATPPAHDEL